MKLDKVKFATLLNWLGRRGLQLDNEDIQDIDNLISIEAPEVNVAYPATSDINELMKLMAGGTQKIEAIKLHRKLTGWGLKESKDEVERHWNRGWSQNQLSDAIANYPANEAGKKLLKTFIDKL